MKKIVFSLQVFGLIALIPVYVVMEMNHGKSTLREIGPDECVGENMQTTSAELSNSIAKYPMAAVALMQGFVKAEKKCSDTGCGCQNCKCVGSCTCGDL
ncbi:hypothetical protein BH11BAC4_BH11BAC4_27200 [soil metagenome]